MDKPSKISKKELIERAALNQFLRNKGIKFDKNRICVPSKKDDIVDICYKREEFQVTTAPAEVQEVEGRLEKEDRVITKNVGGEKWKVGKEEIPKIGWHYNPEETYEAFIRKPIENKISKYGNSPEAAKEVILLIYCEQVVGIPPFKFFLLKKIKEKNEIILFKKTNFKEIYLVTYKETLKIHP